MIGISSHSKTTIELLKRANVYIHSRSFAQEILHREVLFVSTRISINVGHSLHDKVPRYIQLATMSQSGLLEFNLCARRTSLWVHFERFIMLGKIRNKILQKTSGASSMKILFPIMLFSADLRCISVCESDSTFNFRISESKDFIVHKNWEKLLGYQNKGTLVVWWSLEKQIEQLPLQKCCLEQQLESILLN